MKLTANSQNQFKQVLSSAGAILSLASLFAQPLAVQALPTSATINYQISQNNKQVKKIPYKRLVIGGVGLGMAETQVRKVLGQPLTTKNIDMPIAGKTRTLEYSGITVKLLEDAKPTGKFFVYEIEAKSSKYATLDKVKVGDSATKVTTIYGKPESGDTTRLNYAVDYSSPTYFYFTLGKGKVKSIVFGDFLG
ncbi:hypothetical protein Cylst_3809 [Cylindrospermum stagnale PCC 7417]|uniref:Uncharacterized protein n=1 Tax=Cylindrospermum stagnale PCC 7417 TaxID=56107 RepID=K9X2H5_9NOST|nr:hypothetical protein [Cylindrospermum stagnale]AFZ25927.1 hypothetical protein Cylst_3809 [Cylindrospermum stagnale PCC 7417]